MHESDIRLPRHRIFLIGAGAIAVLFLLGALGRAHQKLLWHDEIYTVILARLTPTALWSALADGVDLNPPAFYLVTRAGQRIFGEGRIGTRVPGILGVLLAALCVGLYVRRRHGPMSGLVGMLLLLSSDAYFYAYEARPYGLVLGFAGVALVCWQSATRPGRRAASVAGLTGSLAAAIACHYYAVLLLAPIAAGELSRFLRRRQPDWPLWTSAGCALAPLLVCGPLIEAAREYAPRYFAAPSLRAVLDAYQSTVAGMTIPFLATLVAVGCASVFGRPSNGETSTTMTDAEQDEWVVAASLMLLPVLAYAVAIGWTHALVARYYLPWTLGFSILVPIVVAGLKPDAHRVFAVLAASLLVWFGVRQGSSARWLARPEQDLHAIYPTLVEQIDGDMPIVIAHPHVYLAAVHYAPPRLGSRLVTLADRSATTSDTAIRAFRKLQTVRPLRLEDVDEFTARHRRFLFYGPTPNSTLEKLRRSGALIVLRGEDDDLQLFPMSRPGPSRLFEVTVTDVARAPAKP